MALESNLGLRASGFDVCSEYLVDGVFREQHKVSFDSDVTEGCPRVQLVIATGGSERTRSWSRDYHVLVVCIVLEQYLQMIVVYSAQAVMQMILYLQ